MEAPSGTPGPKEVPTPLATGAIRRWGAEAAVVLCLAGVPVGTLIRSSGSSVNALLLHSEPL